VAVNGTDHITFRRPRATGGGNQELANYELGIRASVELLISCSTKKQEERT
jgi:hypothetical protein